MNKNKNKPEVGETSDLTKSKSPTKSNGKGKFQKKFSRGKSSKSTVLEDGIKAFTGAAPHLKGPNDPSWRTGNKLSTTLAATLPFNNPTGLSIDTSRGSVGTTITLPGILRIRLLLTAGNADDYNSPVNLAARSVYSRIRKANSGSKNYEANDLMLYFLSLQQAYGLCGWLQRLYKTICKYSALDRYTPTTLLTAMDVDYNDVRKHQAELAWLIMWLGSSLNSLAAPKHPVFTASYEAFKHIYVDDSSPRHQLYMLQPWNFGIYDPVYSSAGGGISYGAKSMQDMLTQFSSHSLLFFDDIYAMVHAVMDVLLSDSDIALIAGDIMKAYDDSELFKVQADDTAPIEFEYSEEILQQIHNTRCVPEGYVVFKGYIQAPGSTGTGPYLMWDHTYTNPAADTDAIKNYDIDAFGSTPSPEEIVNCTALQARVKWALKASTNPAQVATSEVTFDLYYPIAVEIYASAGSSSLDFDISKYISDYCVMFGALDEGINASLAFDWTPFTYGEDTLYGTYRPVGDVRMLAFFDFRVHARIHENSVLSLFSLIEN